MQFDNETPIVTYLCAQKKKCSLNMVKTEVTLHKKNKLLDICKPSKRSIIYLLLSIYYVDLRMIKLSKLTHEVKTPCISDKKTKKNIFNS